MGVQKSAINRIIKGTFGVSLYTGLYQVMVLILAIMSARILSIDDFGKVSILQSTSSLFIMFATMGLGTVAVKLVAEFGQKYIASILLFNTLLSFIFSGIVFTCASAIAEYVYQDLGLEPTIELLSFYIFFCGVSQVQSSIIAGKEEYRALAKVNFLVGLSSLILMYYFLKTFGLFGWLYALIVLEISKVFIFQLIINWKVGYISWRRCDIHFGYVASLAIPIALSGFFILPANWLITRELLLVVDYQEVAILNIANQWIAILTFFPIAIGNAMLPILSKINEADNRTDLSSLALKMNFLLSLSLSLIVVFLASFIMGLYGKDYVEYYSVFFYLAPLVIVLSLTNQYNNKVIADNKPYYMVYANLTWLLINLPLTFSLLAAGLGVKGVIIGRFIAYVAKLAVLIKLTKDPSAR